MDTKYDIQLMVKVSQMYYLDNMKQESIAKQLQISRSLISMILSEAKEVGIVDINVRNPLSNNEILAKEIKSIFHLKECIVIPTAVQDSLTLRKLVAQRTVAIFDEALKEQSIIGVAWGRTCYEFISYYRSDKVLKDLNVVPLIGGSSQFANYFQLNEMVRLFAEKTNGIPYFIHAPALASSIEEKELFLKSSSMQTLLEKWSNIDIAISGIGALPNFNDTDRETYIGENEIYKELEKNEAVGDICARYFNIQGKFIKDDYYDRVISVPIEDLKKAKRVICVASGIAKTHSILGALRTKIMDTFVTDEQTAKAVLKIQPP
jgi:DNA-binding transcriptional regulator LsrR (DeoR family)